MRSGFSARNGSFGFRVFAALLLGVRFIVGRRVQKRKENRVGSQRMHGAQKGAALFRRKLFYQLVKQLFLEIDIYGHNFMTIIPLWAKWQ